MLNTFSLAQMITDATRITASTSTVIDHFLTNLKSKITSSGVMNCSFSDHCLIYAVRGSQAKLSTNPVVKSIRCLKNYSKALFCHELRKINWSPVFSAPNVDVALDSFNSLFLTVINKVAPIRKMRFKKDSQPWMNGEILNGIRKRDALFAKVKKDRGNSETYKRFCAQRNLVQRSIKNAKANFFEKGVKECGNDSAKLWRQLGSLGHKAPKGDASIVLESNGQRFFDPNVTSRMFNEFYTKVAAKLVSNLPSPSNFFGFDYCVQFYRSKGIFSPSFSLTPVSRHFIRKQLSALKTNKSTGLDGISPRFLKDGVDYIVDPILHIVNLSISSEIFPSAFKNARVTPLFKKGSRLDVGNYRPVSILPVLSKLLERAVNNQLNEYLSKRDLLYDFQSGFRKGYSTDTCLMNLNDYIKRQTSDGKVTGMIFIDLQKAFDCVDHSLLIRKLSAMGVASTDWFRSYLNDRTQCTQVEGRDSSFLDVNCGVPQGSILGPTLFLCYINDMAGALNCKLSLYADDSALVYSGSDPDIVATFLSQELDTCQKWLIDNRLSIHLGKTECILFGSKRRLNGDIQFEVNLDGQVVQKVTSVKYLGVFVDQCLDFSTHVEGLLKKAHGKLSFLYRNSSFLNLSTRKLLCESLIFSSLEYCSPSWYPGLSARLRDSLSVFKRKCVRFTLGYGPRSHVGEHEFRNLSWMPFSKRVTYFNLLHAYKIRSGCSARYLNQSFTPVPEIHTYNLRQSRFNFSLAHCVSPMGTFIRDAIQDWNSLPAELKAASSLKLFKFRLKRFLLDQ